MNPQKNKPVNLLQMQVYGYICDLKTNGREKLPPRIQQSFPTLPPAPLEY